jgi:hypothetical protein
MAQEFDASTGQTRGTPRATREVVQIDGSTWQIPVSASNNGILAYGLGGRSGNNRLSWFDRSGARIKNLTGFGNYLNIDLAPDDRRVAFEWQQLPLADIWVIDRVTGTRTRISTNPEDETSPVFLADGKTVAYGGRRDTRYRVFVARADGSGAETLLFEDPEHDVWPFSVSRDGKWMLYGNGVASGTPRGSLWSRPMLGNAPPRMLIPEAEQFSGARFSRDARGITCSASVSGRSEVYVSPVPSSDGGLSARWQVSGNGGDRPRWRGDGKELYYVRPDGMVMAASVDGSGNDFRVIGEMPLFQVFQRIITQTIEPTADGQYFVINTLGADEAEPLAIVTHWLQSLPRP